METSQAANIEDKTSNPKGALGLGVTRTASWDLDSSLLKQEDKSTANLPSHLENPYVAEDHKVEPILKVELQV